MLQSIRDRLVGWVAWIFVIMIGVPFAIIGVTDFGGPSRKETVATVNDMSISQEQFRERYRIARQNLQRQLGKNYRPDVFDNQIQKNTLDVLVEEKLLQGIAEEHNIHVGDEELAQTIRNNPAFLKDGQFDFDLYRARIGQIGFTAENYEEYLRQERQMNFLPRLVRGSSFVTEQEARLYQRLAGQTRSIDYAEVARERFLADIEVSEDEARSYYEANKSSFARPEQVQLAYIRVNPASLKDRVEVSDEAVERFYQENSSRYMTEEQRKASHILLNLEEGKSLESSPDVLGKIADIKKRLAAGESFEDLAREYSDDPGSAAQGGSLGQVMRGVMVPPFEDALFALTKEGEVSEPVRSSFGIHLIRLDGIIPRQVKSLAQARDEISADYAKEQALNLYYDVSERLAELSYENVDTLAPAVESLGIELEVTDWVDRNGGDDEVTSNKDVMREAFGEKVKGLGENSDPTEIGVNDVVVFRVRDSRPASELPFEEVSEQVEAAVRNKKADEKIAAFTAELIQRLQQGEDFAELAQQEGLVLHQKDAIERKQADMPAVLTRAVFALNRPAEGKPVVVSVNLAEGKQAVVALKSVTDGATDSIDAQQRDMLLQRLAARDAESLLKQMRDEATVEIFEDKL